MIVVWILIALVSLATLYVVLSPLIRQNQALGEGGNSQAVYEDQLADLDRDVARGVISESEAEALRAETSRRLLESVETENTDRSLSLSSAQLRRAALAIAVVIIGASTLLYAMLGNPHLPGVPASQRSAEREYVQNIEKLAAIMKTNPEDATGWRLLATGYRAMGRIDEAAAAYEQSVTRGKPTADTLTDYGEILLLLNRGTVTTRAREVFEQAVETDPGHQRARYYRALAWMQADELDNALAEFEELKKSSPEDAPWLTGVDARIAEIKQIQEGGAESTRDQIRNNPEILAMVQGLAARLEDEPEDLEGWLRLIRSYAVLGELELAEEARETARTTFDANEEALKAIRTLADELGLSSAE